MCVCAAGAPTVIILGTSTFMLDISLEPDQNFILSLTALGLSQIVTGPTHERGHILDLIFFHRTFEGRLGLRAGDST